MVTRKSPWLAGTPCWADLEVDSVEKATTFYSSLFGWEFVEGPPETGGYRLCTKDGHNVAGLGPKQNPDHPSAWATYLATENADETAAKIKEAGGQVFVEPMDVLDYGRMAVGTDAAGAVFGVWQANQNTGFELANEPGSVTWNENLTGDIEANKKFYAEVFGATFEDMSSDGVNYATFAVPGGPTGMDSAGGLGDLPEGTPEGVPGFWQTYFAVEDADATVAKIEELGGAVVAPAFDMPYGRMAVVNDDQGALFAVIKFAPQS